jgi:hypothetical protein
MTTINRSTIKTRNNALAAGIPRPEPRENKEQNNERMRKGDLLPSL